MAHVDMPDAISEGDGNIISLQLESPPSLSFNEMRLADLRRFQIKPVPGIPLNEQAPGVYLHPTEADTIVTVSADPDILLTVSSESSSYMDELAAEEAAIESEMAKFDESTRKAIDAAVGWYNRDLLSYDAFPYSADAEYEAIHALQRAFGLGQEESPDTTHVQVLRRRALLTLEQWKNDLRPLVVDKFHIQLQANEEARSSVITSLLEHGAFLYQDGDKFRAPIIKDAFEILDRRLLLGSASDSIEYRLPRTTECQAIAFVAAALECCLDEWKSGKRVDLAFKAEAYEARYKEHLENLLPLADAIGHWNF
ncbi:hypothetical protein C8J56DRAFT_913798 [Mycena floridula]|nr:hypothetical protein C8J56DRAFT_913798 [Mycena floridula]